MAPNQPNAASRWTNSGELLRQLLIREISESVKGSFLGVLWLVFNPLLSMALYVVVFGVLFGGNFGRVENESSLSYAVGVYIGITLVNLVNETISKATYNLYQNSNLIKKVAFPVELLPVVQTAGSTFTLAINCLLWLVMAVFFGSTLSWGVLYLPLILFPLIGMSLGLAAFISSLSVYFRDLQHLTSVVTQIIFWSSGVFFSANKVMEVPILWTYLKWNPVLLGIENVRSVVLWNVSPDWNQVIFLYAIAVISLCFGFFVFSRLRAGFSDFL
jgi:lipopolysaccharide transport system permease protein